MNAQYFINKFEAIPEEKWCVGDFLNEEGQSCANGHCGMRNGWEYLNEETQALQKVFSVLEVRMLCGGEVVEDESMDDLGDFWYSRKAARINNGHIVGYQQDTPKQRILAALRDIQALEGTEGAIKLTKQILEDGNRNNSDNEMQLQSRLSGSDIRKGDESTQRKHKRSSLLHRVLSFL